MIVNVENVKGIALDWAIAHVMDLDGRVGVTNEIEDPFEDVQLSDELRPCIVVEGKRFEPSYSWAHGGHIFEGLMHSGLEVRKLDNDEGYVSSLDKFKTSSIGDTVLESTMRCLIAHKVGDDIDIPEELLPKPPRRMRP